MDGLKSHPASSKGLSKSWALESPVVPDAWPWCHRSSRWPLEWKMSKSRCQCSHRIHRSAGSACALLWSLEFQLACLRLWAPDCRCVWRTAWLALSPKMADVLSPLWSQGRDVWVENCWRIKAREVHTGDPKNDLFMVSIEIGGYWKIEYGWVLPILDTACKNRETNGWWPNDFSAGALSYL